VAVALMASPAALTGVQALQSWRHGSATAPCHAS